MEEENNFGSKMSYKKGDIVAWRGREPAIGRMLEDYNFRNSRSHREECGKFQGSNDHNSLHFSNLRLATKTEIEYLGSSVFKLISGGRTV